ncbi:hypothetical protein CAPTEDRAFT_29940, partial [Capitella teleta]
EIADFLEEERGYRCCMHNRDFEPGKRILQQMGESIEGSRRVLCFLSPQFLDSRYCIWEFRQAYEADEMRGNRRLAIIVM